jgi:hypothetical protein
MQVQNIRTYLPSLSRPLPHPHSTHNFTNLHTVQLFSYPGILCNLPHYLLCLRCFLDFRMASAAVVPSRRKPGMPSSHHHQSNSYTCTCYDRPMSVFSVLEHPTSFIHRSEDTCWIARVLEERIRGSFPQVRLAPL